MISKKLEESLHRTLNEANTRGHAEASLEHLLLALLTDSDAATVLSACGADLPLLQEKLNADLNSDARKRPRDDNSVREAKPTAALQRVLQRAAIHVQSSGREEVSGANVIVAMFSERDSVAVRLLQEQEISRLDAVNFIAHGRAKINFDGAHQANFGRSEQTIAISNESQSPAFDALALNQILAHVGRAHPEAIIRLKKMEIAGQQSKFTIELIAESVEELSSLREKITTLNNRLRSAMKENEFLQQKIDEIDRKYRRAAVQYYERYISDSKIDEEIGKQYCAVLFMDIVGSSRMSDEHLLEKVEKLWGIADLALDSDSCITLNTWGDAIAAAIRDPNIAVKAASLLIEVARALKIEMRIGIHWGEVNFVFNKARRRIDFLGEVVNLGARLEPIAYSGEILASKEFVSCHKFDLDAFHCEPVTRALKKSVSSLSAQDKIQCFIVKPRMN